MKVYKKKLKSLKIYSVSESRQGALAATKCMLTTVKANFATTKNFRIKGNLSNPSLLAAANLYGLDPLEHETLGI